MEKSLIVLPGLEGNHPTALTPLQEFLVPYVPGLIVCWWIVWIATLVYLIARHLLPTLTEHTNHS